jgi:hypothetical protein
MEHKHEFPQIDEGKKVGHDHEVKFPQVEKLKQHFQENWKIYAGVGGGTLAGITCCIVRGVASRPISSGITGTADHGITAIGKKVVMSNVSYISANRQGPPSWVVRCKETSELFTSQRAAEMEMGLTAGNVSKYLLGTIPNANGYTFERICMAA